MKVINWLKDRLAKVLIALTIAPWSASAATKYRSLNVVTIQAYVVPYQMNILLFEEMSSAAVVDLYLMTGACSNGTVGHSVLIQHNVSHDNVQFNLNSFGTYCYYALITEPGGAAEAPDLITINLQYEKPPAQ